MTIPDVEVMRYAQEDVAEKELVSRALPLAAKLELGKNYFEPWEYRELVHLFLEGRARRDALSTGTFKVMKKVVLTRVREGELLTLSELSKVVGVPQQTLWRWVSSSDLPFRQIGNKKLYNLNEIKQLLLTYR